MDAQRLRRHLERLPKLYLAYAVFLVALAVAVLLTLGTAARQDLRTLAVALAAPMLVVGALSAFAATELRHRVALGRGLVLLICLPSLFLFPIGTALALYSVYVLESPEAEGYYLARRPQAGA